MMGRNEIEARLSESLTVMLVLVKKEFGERDDDDDDDDDDDGKSVIEGVDMKMRKELLTVTEASDVDCATSITLDATPPAPRQPQ